MRRRQRRIDLVEMQMGPMIDMVFLLLVFFMVTAKPTKPESDIKMTLPGSVSQETSVDLPDEQRIQIEAGGQVILNDMNIDQPNASDMPELVRILTRYKQAADLSKSRALVTLDPQDSVRHQRIVDVLGACARAGIIGVTFADQTSESL
ncbi:MAG: ExbD/TolR family protein [Verrucomicrobiales bacterium]